MNRKSSRSRNHSMSILALAAGLLVSTAAPASVAGRSGNSELLYTDKSELNAPTCPVGGALGNAPGVKSIQACTPIMPSPLEEPPPGWVTTPESSQTRIPDGTRIEVASDRDEYVDQLCHTQLMAEGHGMRDWWIMCGLFSTVVVELGNSLVVVDFGGHNSGKPPLLGNPPQPAPGGFEFQALLSRIHQIAPNKPITDLVPSHPHQDHVGNLDELKAIYPSARVRVTRAYWDVVTSQGLDLVLPSNYVPNWTVFHRRKASWWVEGRKMQVHSPTNAAHTTADTIFISPLGTCHMVDILHLGRLSFVDLSVVMSVEGMIEMLNHLGGLAEQGICKQLSIGHMNVSMGSQSILEDVNFAREYLVGGGPRTGLVEAFWAVMQQVQQSGASAGDFFPSNLEDDPSDPNDPHDYHAHVGITRLFDAINNGMAQIMIPQWETFIGATAMRAHIDQVLQHMFLRRLGSNPFAPPTMPPIQNTTHITYANWTP